MCGIGGCVLRGSRQPDIRRLEAMRDALRHRGPDGDGISILGGVGLVHTRLAIVDLSPSASQPMGDEHSGWWLSYNGEIYNHLALREDLRERYFNSSGDTETLWRSLVEFGPDVVARLNGQFAIAALDTARSRLLLTRDRFGIKPLYTAVTDDGFWFASEPRALVAAGVRPSWPRDGWRAVREGACYAGPHTLAAGIDRLPAGVWASVSLETGALTHTRWATLADGVDPQQARRLRTRSRRSLVDELEREVRRAVHDALMGDVTVGTLCSGGVDSSLITALAAEVKPELVAFAARYAGDPALDEGPAARRAAAAIGVELELLEVEPTSWRRDFASSTVHFGAPLANASSVVIAQMAARAHELGVRVLLTGEGADELFGGYTGLHRGAMKTALSARARLLRALEPALLPGPTQQGGFLLRRVRAVRARRRAEPVWSTLSRTPEAEALDREAWAAYAHHTAAHATIEAALLSRLDYTLSHLLNRMDKNMMQCSVEARVPFLDPRLVNLVLNLPVEARIAPWSKGILRDVARRLLPRDIAHRPKIYGMDFNAGAWIEEAADEAFLLDGLLREVLGVTRHALREEVAASDRALRVRIWSAEIWCRAMLAEQSVTSIERELWPAGP